METYWGLGTEIPIVLPVALGVPALVASMLLPGRRRKRTIITAIVLVGLAALPLTYEVAFLGLMLALAGWHLREWDRSTSPRMVRFLTVGFAVTFLIATFGFFRFQRRFDLGNGTLTERKGGWVQHELSVGSYDVAIERRSTPILARHPESAWRIGPNAITLANTEWFLGPRGLMSGEQVAREIARRSDVTIDEEPEAGPPGEARTSED